MPWQHISHRFFKANESNGLRCILAITAGWYILMFVAIALLRFRYPFDLEWMEGAMLDSVLRIKEGLPLYARPSVEFIPYIYTPLYFYLSALVFQFADASLSTMRLISLGCTVICFFFIYSFVRRATQDRLVAWLSVGLFAATFAASGAWFDLARVDMLALALFFAALALVQSKPGFIIGLSAGALIALSFAAKQSGLMMSLPVMAYFLWQDRKTGLGLALGTVVAIICLSYICTDRFGQWFFYYVFRLPSGHAWVWRNLVTFWIKDTLRILPLALLVIVFYFFRQRANRPIDGFWVSVALGMLGSAFFSRLHQGGFENVLIPAHAALAILFGKAVHHFHTHPLPIGEDGRRFLYLICALQFLLLLYDPLEMIPSAKDRQAGETYLHTIQRFSGDVYLPLHGYLPRRVGKASYSHDMAVADVFRGDVSAVSAGLRADFFKAFSEKRFSAVILDDNYYQLRAALQSGYVATNETISYPYAFTRDKGGPPRMERIYLPRQDDCTTIKP